MNFILSIIMNAISTVDVADLFTESITEASKEISKKMGF